MVNNVELCNKKKELNQEIYKLSTEISDEIIDRYGPYEAKYEIEIVSRRTLLKLVSTLIKTYENDFSFILENDQLLNLFHKSLENDSMDILNIYEEINESALKYYEKELQRIIECRLHERKEEFQESEKKHIKEIEYEIQGSS